MKKNIFLLFFVAILTTGAYAQGFVKKIVSTEGFARCLELKAMFGQKGFLLEVDLDHEDLDAHELAGLVVAIHDAKHLQFKKRFESWKTEKQLIFNITADYDEETKEAMLEETKLLDEFAGTAIQCRPVKKPHPKMSGGSH